MKTDEQILLNYMYMNGYTEEDMHDPKALQIVRKSFCFSVHLLSIRVKKVISDVRQSLQAAFKVVIEKLRPIAAYFEEGYEKTVTDSMKKHPTINDLTKQSISRMSHQVMNNKPRLMVRKIIR